MIPVIHWVFHVLGFDYGLPYGHFAWYNFWSGFGGTVLFSALIVAPAWWWHHQCGVHGCYWYAWRRTAAGEPACWKHHPHPRRTAEDLHASHRAAARARDDG